MLQFDKTCIHPVVLNEYYPICIFMNIHENLKNEGKSRKTYKPRVGANSGVTMAKKWPIS